LEFRIIKYYCSCGRGHLIFNEVIFRWKMSYLGGGSGQTGVEGSVVLAVVEPGLFDLLDRKK